MRMAPNTRCTTSADAHNKHLQPPLSPVKKSVRFAPPARWRSPKRRRGSRRAFRSLLGRTRRPRKRRSTRLPRPPPPPPRRPSRTRAVPPRRRHRLRTTRRPGRQFQARRLPWLHLRTSSMPRRPPSVRHQTWPRWCAWVGGERVMTTPCLSAMDAWGGGYLSVMNIGWRLPGIPSSTPPLFFLLNPFNLQPDDSL